MNPENNEALEAVKKQVRNLIPLKGDEEKILQVAKNRMNLFNDDLDVDSMFSDSKEKKKARILLKKYLNDYDIETISDRNTLKQLIYFEVVQMRLEEAANRLQENLKAAPLNQISTAASPSRYLDALHKNSNQILTLKQTLGISKAKQEKVGLFDTLAGLMRKFNNWRKENTSERSIPCKYCGKMLHFKIRIDKYDVSKHPFFKGRFLTNKYLIDNLDKTITIDREFIAKVLEVSPDYIDFILEHLRERHQDSQDSQEPRELQPTTEQ